MEGCKGMKKQKKSTKQPNASPSRKTKAPKRRKQVVKALHLSDTDKIKLNPDLEERIVKKNYDKKRRVSFFKSLRRKIYRFLVRKLKQWRRR
jgi:hypothetical protein